MLPLMTEAFSGLTQQTQFAILNKTQQNFNTVETIKVLAITQLSLQPLHPRKLLIKPEGERKWKWFSAWGRDDIPVDNYVQDPKGLMYRVMAKSDWSQADYYEFELIQSTTVGKQAS